MKKIFFIILLMAAFLGMKAQQRDLNKQKLDSVVGSNDFGWTQWKKVFTYYEEDSVILDESYRLEDGVWKLSGGNTYQYSTDFKQLQGAITLTVNETGLTPTSWIDYNYDDLDRLTLIMIYTPGDTSWVENSKYEFNYNVDGLLDTLLFSTIRNGNWRESEQSIYSYNEAQQCIGILVQRKGGWGPFGNNWMDSYRYEFEYENGDLVAELYYAGGGGWFGGGEMTLDSKKEYEFDEKGNLLRKTVSIYNGEDWILRDVYENQYDPSVNASAVLGLEPFWNTTVQNGMGYATGAAMPLYSRWTSCSITSSELDTEFTLYCSGFTAVEEHQEAGILTYSRQGNLVVELDQPANVMVYDLLGRVVAQRNQVSNCEFNLNAGLYIVSNGSARVKVIVN